MSQTPELQPDSKGSGSSEGLFEQRLARLAEVIPGALYSFHQDADGRMRFIYMSRGFEQLTGMSAEAVIQDPGLTFSAVHPEDLKGLMDSIQLSAHTLSPWVHEFRVHHPRRGVVWIEGRSVPEAEGEGGLIWQGILLDVTARKQAELEFKAQTERVKSILESAPFGAHAYELSPNGELVFTGYNEAADRILGVSHAAFVGKTILEAFPQLKGTDIPESYVRVAALGERVEDEQVAYEGQDIQGAFEVRAFQTMPSHMAVFFQDITERKKAEASLHKEQALTRAIMDSVPGLLYLYDAEGHLLRWNKQHELQTGYSAEELRGMTLLDWYKDSPEDLERILAGVNKALVEGYAEAEGHLQTKSGKRILYHFSAVRLEIEGKVHFVGMGLDVTEQRKTEAEIRIRDERIRAILEAAPFGAHEYELDDSGELIVVGINAAAERIRGWFAPEPGHSLVESMPILRNSPLIEAYRRVVLTGERIEVEQAFQEPDGTTGEFEIHAFRTSPRRMAVFFREITARKREEQALRDSEQLMEETQKVVRIGSYRLDLVTGQFQSSRTLDDIMGFTESTPKVLQTWESVLHPEERAEVAAYMMDCVVSRHEFSKEYRIVRMGDGAVRWMRGTGSLEFNEEGQPIRMLGVIQDFTAQHLADQAFQQAQVLTQALMESVPGLLFLYDSESRLVRWNKQHEALTGYGPEELSALHLMDWFEGGTTENTEAFQLGLEALAQQGQFEGELQIRIKPGAWVPYHFNAVQLDLGGKPHILGLGLDVTEQHRAEHEIRLLNETLEERVRQRTEALEAANKELDSFTYSVSHDLRAPLRTVDGFSLALMEDFEDQLPEDARRYIRLIREGAQRMGTLIEDLLKFSRMGRAPMNLEKVDMDALVATVISELNVKADPEVQLLVGPLPMGLADPALLKQVWINLVSNALKYSRKSRPARVEIGHWPEKNCYFVRDNGVGFDMKYASKLFQVFQRLHRVEDFEGTGVGLALVRQILGRHGGKIWAEGEPGQGACFMFTLPASEGASHA